MLNFTTIEELTTGDKILSNLSGQLVEFLVTAEPVEDLGNYSVLMEDKYGEGRSLVAPEGTPVVKLSW